MSHWQTFLTGCSYFSLNYRHRKKKIEKSCVESETIVLNVNKVKEFELSLKEAIGEKLSFDSIKHEIHKLHIVCPTRARTKFA